jgi:hypothetical protein
VSYAASRGISRSTNRRSAVAAREAHINLADIIWKAAKVPGCTLRAFAPETLAAAQKALLTYLSEGSIKSISDPVIIGDIRRMMLVRELGLPRLAREQKQCRESPPYALYASQNAQTSSGSSSKPMTA